MKRFTILLILTVLISGCRTTPTHDMTENAQTALTALEQSIPEQCATESIKTQIKGIKTQINTIEKNCTKICEDEKAVIRADKIKWQVAFFGLLGVIIAWFMGKRI